MAFYDNSFPARQSTLRSRFARLFDTPFDRRQRQLTARMAYLRSLSDAQLSDLGMTRDTILIHVFGGR
ncbi:hypothetical protein [Primorskyibacter sp. 2E233]|uniref:hypothetical protein n=1 Tax=Primorskyibacter sp. 2E233 TaxID=3413431 RepID=UPI003BEFACEE